MATMAFEHLLVFLAGTAVILVVPGPAVLFAVARTVEGGRIAGLVSVAGLETGLTLHVAAAAGGLTAVIASSPTALATLRYLGAGYLVLLAIMQWRHTSTGTARHRRVAQATTGRQLFRDALLVDVLNPKTGLFFLAFLPQFLDPGRGPVPLQVLALGSMVVAIALVCDVSYVLLTALLWRRRTHGSAGKGPRMLAWVTSTVYVSLAALTVLG